MPELTQVRTALEKIASVLGGIKVYFQAIGQYSPTFSIWDVGWGLPLADAYVEPWSNEHEIKFQRKIFRETNVITTIIHEIGHFVHFTSGRSLSTNGDPFDTQLMRDFMKSVGTACLERQNGEMGIVYSAAPNATCTNGVGSFIIGRSYVSPREQVADGYAGSTPWEDFAESWQKFINDPVTAQAGVKSRE